MSSLAATVVRMQAGALSQQVGAAVARQQVAAQRAVADLVAGTTAGSRPPSGQGNLVDRRV